MILSKKQELGVVTLFLLIFSFFIFNHIALAPFWLDEADTANLLSFGFKDIFYKSIVDLQPIFYIFLLKLWSLFFGNNEFILRLFSSICAIGSLVTIYVFCKKWFDKKVAIIATALASTSYFLIWFSNQNRPYTLIVLLSILSYHFFLKVLDNHEDKDLFLYILITVSGFYTHVWFYFLFGAQIVSFLIWFRKKIYILYCQIFIFLLSIPGIFIAFYQKSLGANSWITNPGFDDITKSFHFFFSNYEWVYLGISAIALSIVISGVNKIDINVKTKIICLYFFIPLITAFVISQYLPVYVAGRYEIIVLPAFIILVSIIWSSIDSIHLVIVFIILFGLALYTDSKDRGNILSQKSNDKNIITTILNKTENNDLIISTDLSWSTVYYYISTSKVFKEKALHTESFPEEIKSHPGWKNADTVYFKKDLYKSESLDLVKNIKANKNIKQIWVFYNKDNEINHFIISDLEKVFGPAQIFLPNLPRQNSWFYSVYLFRNMI